MNPPDVTAHAHCSFIPPQAYYSYNAVTQSSTMDSAMLAPSIPASALQLTEYSDATCTASVATKIVTSYPFIGCSNGVQVKTLPASVTNPCFYFRQSGYISSTTGDPPMPLLPGTWTVNSTYTTAAGCTDATKQARPLVCSATLGTDPKQHCQPQACSVRSRDKRWHHTLPFVVVSFTSLVHVVVLTPRFRLISFFSHVRVLQVVPDAQVDPFGLQIGDTCLSVAAAAPSSAPTTTSPTRSPTRTPTTSPPTTSPTTSPPSRSSTRSPTRPPTKFTTIPGNSFAPR